MTKRQSSMEFSNRSI